MHLISMLPPPYLQQKKTVFKLPYAYIKSRIQ
uniref:Uncharacterized protein n=1 Tax=Siphoviridae sp. cttKr9 TaxID=2825706 RepID=A0A8S5V3L8_9CAUD|nr:MAG TPA: hypothetical protein [Siphoviridae sp. cttKr9]